MQVDDLFPSRYLSSGDLQGREFRLSIAGIHYESMDDDAGGKTEKPVMRFHEAQKGMVLNKTNASVLADAFGQETDDWIGRQIVLYVARVDFRGKRVDGLRVRPAVPAAQSPAGQQAAGPAAGQPAGQQPAAGGFDPAYESSQPGAPDDEIPF